MRTKLLFTSLISGLNFEQQIKLQIYPFSLTAMEIFLVFVNIIQQNNISREATDFQNSSNKCYSRQFLNCLTNLVFILT